MSVTRVKTSAGWVDLNTVGPKGDKGEPGYTDFSLRAAAGSVVSVPVGTTYTHLPLGTVTKSALADECFRVNADGSVSILETGWYVVTAVAGGSAFTAANGIRAIIWFSLTDVTPAPPANYHVGYQEQTANSSGQAWANIAGVMNLDAGWRIGVGFFHRDSSARNCTMQTFSIARIGAGAQGERGATGTTGAPGLNAVWTSGTGAPAGGVGKVGDWYLNDANGDVYEKTATLTWTLRDNITGPAGPIGPTGSQGVQGPPGPPLPLGGTTGQALVKKSNADSDTEWGTAGAPPEVLVATAEPTGTEILWIDTDEPSPIFSAPVASGRTWRAVAPAAWQSTASAVYVEIHTDLRIVLTPVAGCFYTISLRGQWDCGSANARLQCTFWDLAAAASLPMTQFPAQSWGSPGINQSFNFEQTLKAEEFAALNARTITPYFASGVGTVNLRGDNNQVTFTIIESVAA